MKKLTLVLAIVGTFASGAAFAETENYVEAASNKQTWAQYIYSKLGHFPHNY